MVPPDLARAFACLAATELGRGSEQLAAPVLDDLAAACDTLGTNPAGHTVGIVTGFYIPRAAVPAAETDGPLGTAVLAQVLTILGARVDVVTDPACHPIVAAALDAAGVGHTLTDPWPDMNASEWTHAIAVERPGRDAGGRHRNMYGHDITDVTPPVDVWFDELTIPKTGIGDGGNEIGMGRLTVHHPDQPGNGYVTSVIGCDHLIVGGTSNWAAHALAVALTFRAVGPVATLFPALTEQGARTILDAMVAAGAVDGVTALNTPTVDMLDWDAYWAVPAAINSHADKFRP